MIRQDLKWPEEALELVKQAVAFLHTDMSEFVRQAAIEKARHVLGKEPTCPLYTQGSRVSAGHQPTKAK